MLDADEFCSYVCFLSVAFHSLLLFSYLVADLKLILHLIPGIFCTNPLYSVRHHVTSVRCLQWELLNPKLTILFSFYPFFIVACGHVSCFWCVHKSMNSMFESYCPICRHPYHHFPTISQTLHLLLLKLYPTAHKRREEQTLGEFHTLKVYLCIVHGMQMHDPFCVADLIFFIWRVKIKIKPDEILNEKVHMGVFNF